MRTWSNEHDIEEQEIDVDGETWTFDGTLTISYTDAEEDGRTFYLISMCDSSGLVYLPDDIPEDVRATLDKWVEDYEPDYTESDLEHDESDDEPEDDLDVEDDDDD